MNMTRLVKSITGLRLTLMKRGCDVFLVKLDISNFKREYSTIVQMLRNCSVVMSFSSFDICTKIIDIKIADFLKKVTLSFE